MPLINYLEQPEYTTANGVDTTNPIMNMRPGYVRDALNCNVGLTSGWIKRQGYVKTFATAWGTRTITGGVEFKKVGGSLVYLLFGRTNSVGSGTLGVLESGNLTPTNLVTGLSNAARPAFAQFKERLFFYNGADAGLLYDGTGTRQIGISAPTVAPTGTAGGAGDLTTGQYIYAYTHYNSTTKAESSPSPLSASITSAGSDTITLAIAAGSATTADKTRIWRTVANGNQLFLEAEILVSATSHISTASDNELGRPLELDNSRLADLTTSLGKFPVVADSRVFVVTGDNEVRYSAIGYDNPMPESFQVKAVVSTSGTFGNADTIVGLGNIGDLCVVIKRRSIGVLQPIDLPSFNSEVDTQGFRYVEISDSVGGVSHWVGGQVENEYVFATRNSIYATDGKTVRQAGTQDERGQWACTIQATVRALGWAPSQIDKVSFGNDPKNKRVYIQVFLDSDETIPKLTLVGDYQQYPSFRWTFYGPGPNEATHPGIQAASFFNGTNEIDGSIETLFGTATPTGLVYTMNKTEEDGTGKGIYYQLVTRPLDLGFSNEIKLYKHFTAQVLGSGTDYVLQMAALYDLGRIENATSSVALIADSSRWDDPQYVWDAARWTSDDSIQAKYSAHRKARFIQMIFRQPQPSSPVTVFGWNPTGSLFKS